MLWALIAEFIAKMLTLGEFTRKGGEMGVLICGEYINREDGLRVVSLNE